jgi:maltose operon protein
MSGLTRANNAVLRLMSAAFFGALVSCAVPYTDVMKGFEAAQPCCASMADLPFRQLPVGQPVKIELTASSPAYLFDSGKSYFAAYALPAFTGPCRIVVESFMIGDQIDKAYLFFPHVLTLDGDHRVVRSAGRDLFTLQKAGMTETWGLPHKLAGAIEVREENRDERYLVILTTEELLRARTSLATMKVVPFILPGIVGALPAGKEMKLIRHAPVGKLVIRLEPFTP